MIDLSSETVMPLSKAAHKYPGGGKHVCQLHRYRMSRDTPLECVKVGGVWMTSEEAMRRHVYRRTQRDQPTNRTERSVGPSRRVADAESELAKHGI